MLGLGFLFFFFGFIPFLSTCSPTNRSIDDTNGDIITGFKPVYSPSTVGVWKNAGCTDCAVIPDKALAFDGTWTSATYNPGLKRMSVDLEFHGTGIYVFLILANNVAPGITTLTDCNFTLDGNLVGTFRHDPTTSTALQYNASALAYANNSLSNNNHILSIVTAGPNSVLVVFDYALYTFEDTVIAPSSHPSQTTATTTRSSTRTGPTVTASAAAENGATSKSHGLPPAAISGLVIGGTVLIAISLFIFSFHGKIKRRFRPSAKIPEDGISDDPPRSTQVDGTASYNPGNTFRGAHINIAATGTLPSRPSLRSADMTSDNPYSPPPSSWTPDSRRFTRGARTVLSALPSGLIVMSAGSISGRSSPEQPLPSSGAIATPMTAPLHFPRRTDVVEMQRMREIEIHRSRRQVDLENQMRRIKQEMRELQEGRPIGRGASEWNASDTGEQIALMNAEIDRLHEYQRSDWGQGLSDEPPPDYSPNPVSFMK